MARRTVTVPPQDQSLASQTSISVNPINRPANEIDATAITKTGPKPVKKRKSPDEDVHEDDGIFVTETDGAPGKKPKTTKTHARSDEYAPDEDRLQSQLFLEEVRDPNKRGRQAKRDRVQHETEFVARLNEYGQNIEDAFDAAEQAFASQTSNFMDLFTLIWKGALMEEKATKSQILATRLDLLKPNYVSELRQSTKEMIRHGVEMLRNFDRNNDLLAKEESSIGIYEADDGLDVLCCKLEAGRVVYEKKIRTMMGFESDRLDVMAAEEDEDVSTFIDGAEVRDEGAPWSVVAHHELLMLRKAARIVAVEL